MTKRWPSTYEGAVTRFVRANRSWLDDEHAPAITALRNMAAALDEPGPVHGPTLTQFSLTYRWLVGQRPSDDGQPSGDPTETLLGDVQGG